MLNVRGKVRVADDAEREADARSQAANHGWSRKAAKEHCHVEGSQKIIAQVLIVLLNQTTRHASSL